MTFQIGKTYKHTTGKVMKIIGELDTTIYGKALIGECDDGTLIPCGKSEDATVNWEETNDLIEYLMAE